MDLEIIMLSEVGHTEKDKCCMLSLIYELIYKTENWELIWKGTYDNPGQSQRCVLPKEEAMSTKCCDEAQVPSTGLMLLLLPRPDLSLKENTGKVFGVKGIVARN